MRSGVHVFVVPWVVAVTCLLAAGEGWADDAAGKVRKANRLMERKSYPEAAGLYREALGTRPDSPEVAYNLANALYRESRWEESEKTYAQAGRSADKALSARVYYNQGNAQFGQGRLQDAIDSYARAVELNPGDADAKHNLEYARQKLKELLQKAEATQAKLREAEKAGQDGGADSESGTADSGASTGDMSRQENKTAGGEAASDEQRRDDQETLDAKPDSAAADSGQKSEGADEEKLDQKSQNPQGELKDLKTTGADSGRESAGREGASDSDGASGDRQGLGPKSNSPRPEPSAAERGLDAFERRQDRWLLPPTRRGERARNSRVERDW